MAVDVAVLGGGLVGCLTALRLASQGWRCTLVDSRRPFEGASVTNAGGLYFQLQPDATTFDAVQTRKLADLARLVAAARGAWDRLQHLLQGPCGLFWSGGLIVADDEEGMACLQAKRAQEAAWGIPTELLGAGDVRRLIPKITPEIRGATFSKEEGFCDTAVLAAAVRPALDRAGVQVRAGAAVVGVTAGEVFRLKLAGGATLEAPVLVGCLGAFTDDLLGMLGLASGLVRLPLQIHEMDAPAGVLPIFTRYVGGRLSLKQFPSGRILVGGGWPAKPQPDDAMAVVLSRESRRRNLALARRVVPALAGAAYTGWRGGWAAWTRDGLPVIGGHASVPGFYGAAGGNGFTLAPLYAEILASLAQGQRPSIELAAFSPERFCAEPTAGALPPDG